MPDPTPELPLVQEAAPCGRVERGRRRLWWAAALSWLAWLGALPLLFEYVGETAWPVVVLLYLPAGVGNDVLRQWTASGESRVATAFECFAGLIF